MVSSLDKRISRERRRKGIPRSDIRMIRNDASGELSGHCRHKMKYKLYFHPELQRTYLKRLFDGIKQVDIPNIKSLNICFVTHSPFVLSDIPARNILALKKDTRDTEKISLSTFGANIHEMLKNSFFLKNGSIGDYASWVITQIIESLQNVADKKEIINTDVELHNKIMLIDEPIKRNVLLREYHKFYPSNSKEQEIAELKKKLAELENNK